MKQNSATKESKDELILEICGSHEGIKPKVRCDMHLNQYLTRRNREVVNFKRYRVKNNSKLTNFEKFTRIEGYNGKYGSNLQGI